MLIENINFVWNHPNLDKNLSELDLSKLSYSYLIKFLPFFKNTKEGSIESGIQIDFSKKMRNTLGCADLRDQLIVLNQSYFKNNTTLLPYTLFHEITHLWLYNCNLDPGHTARFYKKMQQFAETGLPLDTRVHIHKRMAAEGKFVYICPNCKFRWYQAFKSKTQTYCGHCEKESGKKFYIHLFDSHHSIIESNLR